MENFKNKFIGSGLCIVFAICLTLPLLAQSESAETKKKWMTFSEQTGYRETPRYGRVISFSKRLAAHSKLISYQSIGISREGREIPLLIAASDGEFTPKAAKKAGKPIILIQAGIHSGESDGKDAGLALFRDIAVTGNRADLLKNAIILFIPIYNVDGHELFSEFNRINQNGPEKVGFRANSARQNLNRDYMKVDNPETRGWLKMWNEWKPDMFIDCHVTDGADFQFNITYEFARHGEIAPQLSDWMNEHFVRNTVPRIEADGNLVSPYLQFADAGNPEKGIYSFIATPRFATGYTPLRNRNGLLIEAHSVKPYRSRVRGTYDVIHHFIAEIANNSKSLLEVNAEADALTNKLGKTNADLPLRFRINNETKDFLLKGFKINLIESKISGGKKIVFQSEKLNTVIPWYDFADVTASATVPNAYIIPPQWTEAIDRLVAHGVEFSRLSETTEIPVEMYRINNPKWASKPFEGRITMSYQPSKFETKYTFAKGSAVVPMNQEAARIAVNLFEPSAPDSLLFWGFFNSIFEQKEYSEGYIMESIAEEMLAKDPSLRKEFEEKLKDEAFANNKRARLSFFFERSRFYESDLGLYPVGRIMKPLDSALVSDE